MLPALALLVLFVPLLAAGGGVRHRNQKRDPVLLSGVKFALPDRVLPGRLEDGDLL